MAKKSKFNAAEEAKIKKAVEKQKAKARKAEIEAEILNRIADEQRKQPGYKYY